MRDIKRIEPLLETVRKIWLERPDYRLMQLFGNVYRGDPYHMEDDELLQRLESTYLPERDACINAEIPVALEGEISISKVKDLVRKVSDLQAQLRQVEEALQERKEFIADCDTALDRIQAPRTNEGQEELVSTWRRIELLGKLLYQYRQELERSAPALRAENAWQRCGTCALSEGVYEDICTQKESCVNSAQPTTTASTGFLMSMWLVARYWCYKGRSVSMMSKGSKLSAEKELASMVQEAERLTHLSALMDTTSTAIISSLRALNEARCQLEVYLDALPTLQAKPSKKRPRTVKPRTSTRRKA